jgi:hypothetical protein
VSDLKLTREEHAAIATLERLAKRWPKSLWLFSANGELNVMRYAADGQRGVEPNGGIDQTFSVATIDINNDGGDW